MVDKLERKSSKMSDESQPSKPRATGANAG